MKVGKVLVLGAIAIVSCTIISCEKKGNEEEGVLRGRSVPGVQGVRVSTVPEEIIVEAKNLIAEVEKEFERLGTGKKNEAKQEGDVNKVISERHLGGKYSQEVIEAALGEELEGNKGGLIRKVLERLKRSGEKREEEIVFSELEDEEVFPSNLELVKENSQRTGGCGYNCGSNGRYNFINNQKEQKEEMKFGFESGKSPLDREAGEIYSSYIARKEEEQKRITQGQGQQSSFPLTSN